MLGLWVPRKFKKVLKTFIFGPVQLAHKIEFMFVNILFFTGYYEFYITGTGRYELIKPT